jgi:chromosomal replication initiator protein
MLKKKEIWNQITAHMERHIAASEFQTWFSQTSLKRLGPKLAVIEVANKFVASWLRDNYSAQIRRSFEESLNLRPEVRFTYPRPGVPEHSTDAKGLQGAAPGFLHRLDPGLHFDNFITGKGNQFAYASALDVAKRPAQAYNPLFIFSDMSAGKTHLLNAIGNHMLERDPAVRVRYHSKKNISFDYSTAKRQRRLPQFRKDYESLDCLILDEFHLLTANEKLQRELAALMGFYAQSGRQVVVAAKNPPGQIQNLMPELRSRLEGGLISEISQPDQNTKIGIIKAKAKVTRVNIPQDVAFFLANSTDDLKRINQYLVGLETYTSIYQREIDLSTAKSLIKNRSLYNINVRDIQKVTSGYFNITLKDLLSNKKKRIYSYPRQVAMYLTRRLTGLSFDEIGKAFGNKDHSTVIYAVRRIQNEISKKADVLSDLNKIQSRLS